jgi:quinoprotein glucose dehydrogenase
MTRPAARAARRDDGLVRCDGAPKQAVLSAAGRCACDASGRPTIQQRRAIPVAILAMLLTAAAAGQTTARWPAYGGDAGGQRYSAATTLTPRNVGDLVPAWSVRTGDLLRRSSAAMKRSNFEGTGILTGDALVFCTPFNELIALDPGTGDVRWRFDPHIATDTHPGNGYTCRGVAAWTDSASAASRMCRDRIFMGTADARLVAVDAKSGKPCQDFGAAGEVRIDPEMPLEWPGEFQITSPPVAAGDTVIIGSSISDNARVVAPHGTVRAFDARTGAARWSWDPVPRDPRDPAAASWGDGYRTAGHANVWAPMSVDQGRGLVFLPTSSPSPDFFGGLRPGANQHADSVVALRAATGELVWAYQIVHHDLWDYDLPAQPTLATLTLESGSRDVVIQGTKQGFLFVLDRDTGQPVFPVEERAVPQGGAPGETLAPTQPQPTHIPSLVPQHIDASEAFGVTPWDRGVCERAIAAARHDGLYTPPSAQGTLLFPFTGGGINWGGIAFDPVHQIVYANTSRLIHRVTLFPAGEYATYRARFPDKEVSPQTGAPFGMKREVLTSPLDLPCNPPPWGVLAAVDVRAGKILWQSRLGTTEEIAPLGLALHTGTPSFGGPLVTASGIVFIGATMDRYLRAFDAATGAELWQGRLPAPAEATPMTYEWQGRQYVVVAAGGHRDTGVAPGDSIVAFALPRPGDPGPTLASRYLDRPGGHFVLRMTLAIIVLAALAWLLRRIARGRRAAHRVVRPDSIA